MLCCTMHCRWRRKPPKLSLPLGFRHPTGGGPIHGHRLHPQKFGIDQTSRFSLTSTHVEPLGLLLCLRQPHSGTTIPDSPIPAFVTSSFDSLFCSFVTSSLFHSRLKTYLFHKSFFRSFTSPPRLPSRTITRPFLLSYPVFVVSFFFPLFFWCRAPDYAGPFVIV